MNKFLRLNLGSGVNKMDGYVNVDKYGYGKPDIIMDLEQTPWQFLDDSVEEIMLNHTLEHLGKDTQTFFAIIKEMYRVCKHDALIEINVPHPRHDHFINDPTHVRIVTPALLDLFSKKNCLMWEKMGVPNSPLALYLDVDFQIESSIVNIEKKYLEELNAGKLTKDELMQMIDTFNNIATSYKIIMRPIKQKADSSAISGDD